MPEKMNCLRRFMIFYKSLIESMYQFETELVDSVNDFILRS